MSKLIQVIGILCLANLFSSCGGGEDESCINSILGEWQFIKANNTCEGEIDFENNCDPQDGINNCGHVLFTSTNFYWQTYVDNDYDSWSNDYEFTDKLLIMESGSDGVFEYEFDCDKLILNGTDGDECDVIIELQKID